MKLLVFLAFCMCVDTVVASIVHATILHDFVSTKMKEGCLKKVAILLIGAVFVVLGKYFHDFDYLKYTITPFVLSELVSLKETYDLLNRKGSDN